MDIHEIRQRRLRELIEEQFDGIVAAFVRCVNQNSPKRRDAPLQDSYVNRILKGEAHHRKRLGEALAREFETAAGKPHGWLDQRAEATQVRAKYTANSESERRLREDYVLVPSVGWRGSCGGGRSNGEPRASPLAFQRSWLKSKGVDLENALLICADGDSMSDFIIDGDVVLFDRAGTAIESGKVFAIAHPEGARIKRVRIDFDGNVVLSSDNPDKRRFPDEIIPRAQAKQLRIIGRFVWRGGG